MQAINLSVLLLYLEDDSNSMYLLDVCDIQRLFFFQRPLMEKKKDL